MKMSEALMLSIPKSEGPPVSNDRSGELDISITPERA
jgi:hypothetical protein